MNPLLAEKLRQEGLISEVSLERIKLREAKRLFSVHWDLKTLLYLGVLLLTGGLGILVYKNIDTIGHTAVLLFIAAVSAGSFYYCFRHRVSFSPLRTASPGVLFDYLLLLACLSFVILIGYWQYQYQVFGDRFGLVLFIPMLVLFFCAYYFDHIGILSLAITNLAAWAGIVVTPTQLLKLLDFDNGHLINTGLVLGVVLVGIGYVSRQKNVKAHFEFTYTNLGMHLLFVSGLSDMFYNDKVFLLWFLLITGIAVWFYIAAVQRKSFYIMLMLTLYFYVALSYVVVRLLFDISNESDSSLYLGFLYFIGSAIGLILFLIRINKKLKA